MNGPGAEWQALSDAFSTFGRHIDQARTANINADSLRAEAKDVAQQYFRRTKPALQGSGLGEYLDVLNSGFQKLLELSEGRNATTSYKKQIKIIRKIVPKVTSRIELNQSVSETIGNFSEEDERLVQTLEVLVPSAALSYRAVTSAEGYVQEKGRTGPTMRQKVRFILKSRGQSKSSSSVPEQTTTTVDEMVGTLTRSIYDRSSVAAHVASERKTVTQIRRYVVAVLHDILEL